MPPSSKSFAYLLSRTVMKMPNLKAGITSTIESNSSGSQSVPEILKENKSVSSAEIKAVEIFA